MRLIHVTICGALFLAVGLALGARSRARAAEPEKAAEPKAASDRYEVLTERNIFLRDRRRRNTGPKAAPEAPPPERTTVLTGIVHQGTEYVAFLEDRKTNATTKVRVGDALLEGRVEQITLDYIEYAKNDKTIKVEVGKSLEGAEPESASSAVEAGSAVGGTASEASPKPAGSTDGGDGGVLERLRQRRLAESGGQ